MSVVRLRNLHTCQQRRPRVWSLSCARHFLDKDEPTTLRIIGKQSRALERVRNSPWLMPGAGHADVADVSASTSHDRRQRSLDWSAGKNLCVAGFVRIPYEIKGEWHG
jgi:hypothetical protein